MTVKLSFEFPSTAEAAEFLSRCTPHAAMAAMQQTVEAQGMYKADQKPTPPPGPAPVKEVEVLPAKGKRGPKLKSVEVVEVAPAAPAAKAPTTEAVIAALKALNAKKGMQPCLDLLATYIAASGHPCVRGSEVQEQDRADIIAKCEAA